MEGVHRDGAQCSVIRPILQDIDPLFDVAFNYDQETYDVMFNGGLFERVPYQDVDRYWFEETRKTYWLNKTGKMLESIEESEAAMEAAEDKKLSDMARDMAENLRKPLIETHYYRK